MIYFQELIQLAWISPSLNTSLWRRHTMVPWWSPWKEMQDSLICAPLLLWRCLKGTEGTIRDLPPASSLLWPSKKENWALTWNGSHLKSQMSFQARRSPPPPLPCMLWTGLTRRKCRRLIKLTNLRQTPERQSKTTFSMGHFINSLIRNTWSRWRHQVS